MDLVTTTFYPTIILNVVIVTFLMLFLTYLIQWVIQYLMEHKKYTINIPLVTKCIPVLLRHKGIFVKHIEDLTKTNITVMFDKLQNKYKCKITGNKISVDKAKEKLKNLLNEKIRSDSYEMTASSDVGDTLNRPENKLLNNVEIETRAVIQVNKNVDYLIGPYTKITITGNFEKITKAVSLLKDKFNNKIFHMEGKKTEIKLKCPLDINKYTHFKGYVTKVDNPQRFYVQLHTFKTYEFNHLIIQMKQFYSNPVNREVYKLDNVTLGKTFAVKHTDGFWYRCEVLEINDNDCCIYYIDTGIERYSVDIKDIYKLHTSFDAYLVQAMECSLYNVIADLNDQWDWTDKAIERFKSLCGVGFSEKLCLHIRGVKPRPYDRGIYRKQGQITFCVDLYKRDMSITNIMASENLLIKMSDIKNLPNWQDKQESYKELFSNGFKLEDDLLFKPGDHADRLEELIKTLKLEFRN